MKHLLRSRNCRHLGRPRDSRPWRTVRVRLRPRIAAGARPDWHLRLLATVPHA